MTRSDLLRKRLSRTHFTNTDHVRTGFAGNGMLLWRDAHTGILGYNDGYRAIIEPGDDDLEAWLIELIDIGHFHKQYLTGAISGFIEEVANHLTYVGEGFFEIVSEHNGTSLPPTTLAPLPPGTATRHRRGYTQLVPEEDRTPGGPSVISISRSRMWHVQLPRQLGAPKQYRALLTALAVNRPLPQFVLESSRLGLDDQYDFTAHRGATDIATELLTRSWGSIPSLQRISGTTEFYYVARRLQFRRSQALIGEHIIAELNKLVRRLGVAAEIRIEGLITASEIQDNIDRLTSGEIGLSAALKACEW